MFFSLPYLQLYVPFSCIADARFCLFPRRIILVLPRQSRIYTSGWLNNVTAAVKANVKRIRTWKPGPPCWKLFTHGSATGICFLVKTNAAVPPLSDDWPRSNRSNSTIPPIASAALSRGRNRYAWIFITRINPARLRSWRNVKVNSVCWWASDYRAVAMGFVKLASKKPEHTLPAD